MAARVDPPEMPDEEETEGERLARVLGHLAATARPVGALDSEMIGQIALAADYLDAHTFRLKKARLTATEPSAVLADIVGPARAASVGAVCAVGMDGPWLWGGCNRLDGKYRDSAARGAGESEEP